MAEYILEAKDVIFKYNPDTLALNRISVKIEKGKKTVFLGENGAGKSTLFLHFNGILRPDKGKIFFNDQEVKYGNSYLKNLRKSVGIVFQDPDTQLFSASVYQEVSFGPMNLDFSIEKVKNHVDSALNTTGITDIKDKPTHFLSFGQKKRVSIASIIAMEPEVIIFDEPTNYLDPKYKVHIMDFLTELNKSGITVILSTHDLDLAFTWADHIFVMKNGQLIGEGGWEEIFTDFDFLKSANLMPPFVLETYYELKKYGFIDHNSAIPRTKEELFELISHASAAKLAI